MFVRGVRIVTSKDMSISMARFSWVRWFAVCITLGGALATIASACSDPASDETASDGGADDVTTNDVAASDARSLPADGSVPDDAPVDAVVDDGTAPDADAADDGTSPGDSGGGPEILLAHGQKLPSAVAVDGTSIYWGNQGDGTIMKCPLAGCGDGGAPEVIAKSAGMPQALVLTSTDIYWVSFFGGVRKCPKSGCPDAGPYDFPADKGFGIAVDATRVYWTELTSDVATGRVAACPLSGCADASILYEGAEGPAYGIAVDATNVYWPNTKEGRVYSAPLTGVPDGGAPRLLAQGYSPAHTALTTTSLFFSNQANPGTVSVVPLDAGPDGSTATTFADGQEHVRALVVDQTNSTLYWAAAGTGNVDGGVFRCPTAGCPDAGPIAFAVHQGGPVSVAIDTSFVYWANRTDGTVWKRAK